ncbi:MAG: DUF2357 domain-containing protein [Salinivirgaceae bacterium]|nr:DUF2357 domain-containing protein [Salinivirgaceae bacterium]
MQQDVIRFESDDFEVVVRTTDNLQYSWQRFCGRVNQTAGVTPRTYCRYTSSQECEFSLFNIENAEFALPVIGTKWDNLWPVVFETNAYQISIKAKNGTEGFKILHIRKDVADSFYADDEKRTKLVGNVDFMNNPGLFRLEFEYVKDERPQSAFVTFDVCSPKLDTHRDYKSILQAVNKEYNDIIYRYLSITFQQFCRGQIRNNIVWMQAFAQVVDDYLKNVRFIANNPNIKTRTHSLSRRADHIKHWTIPMEEQYAEAEKEKRHDERYFTYSEYENTIDTPENRFVKHTLDKIGDRLKLILDKVLKDSKEELSDDYRQRWTEYRASIERLQRHPFFKQVGRFSGMSGESLVLQNRHGYRQIYKDWLKLRRGIELYDGAANIGTLQIWEIYELWCFVKMKHLVCDVLGINADMPNYNELLIEPKETFLNPFTDSRLEHKIEFHYPVPPADDDSIRANQLRAHAGDVVELVYQHTYNRRGGKDGTDEVRTATTEQRPDIVLNIRKANGDIMLTYLYDAKYRVISDARLDKDIEKLDAEELELLQVGCDYPPSDAINQMHRYRDAIYYGSNRDRYAAKEVIGGYILFPGRCDEETLKKRYFSESVESVNIGAFPLLPNENEVEEGKILRQHLEEILLNKTTSFEHTEKAIPQRGLQYVSEQDSKVLVLIAPTRSNREKYEWCLNNNKYPVPLTKAHELANLMLAQYAVLYCDKDNFKFKHISRGNVEIVSKEQLEERGYPSPSKDNYLLLTLTSRDNRGILENSTISLEKLGKNADNVLVVDLNVIVVSEKQAS